MEKDVLIKGMLINKAEDELHKEMDQLVALENKSREQNIKKVYGNNNNGRLLMHFSKKQKQRVAGSLEQGKQELDFLREQELEVVESDSRGQDCMNIIALLLKEGSLDNENGRLRTSSLEEQKQRVVDQWKQAATKRLLREKNFESWFSEQDYASLFKQLAEKKMDVSSELEKFDNIFEESEFTKTPRAQLKHLMAGYGDELEKRLRICVSNQQEQRVYTIECSNTKQHVRTTEHERRLLWDLMVKFNNVTLQRPSSEFTQLFLNDDEHYLVPFERTALGYSIMYFAQEAEKHASLLLQSDRRKSPIGITEADSEISLYGFVSYGENVHVNILLNCRAFSNYNSSESVLYDKLSLFWEVLSHILPVKNHSKEATSAARIIRPIGHLLQFHIISRPFQLATRRKQPEMGKENSDAADIDSDGGAHASIASKTQNIDVLQRRRFEITYIDRLSESSHGSYEGMLHIVIRHNTNRYF